MLWWIKEDVGRDDGINKNIEVIGVEDCRSLIERWMKVYEFMIKKWIYIYRYDVR